MKATRRPRKYCSDGCKMKAYRQRQQTGAQQEPTPVGRRYIIRDAWSEPYALPTPHPAGDAYSRRLRLRIGPSLRRTLQLSERRPAWTKQKIDRLLRWMRRAEAPLHQALPGAELVGMPPEPSPLLAYLLTDERLSPPEPWWYANRAHQRSLLQEDHHRRANPLHVTCPRRPDETWHVHNRPWFPLPAPVRVR